MGIALVSSAASALTATASGDAAAQSSAADTGFASLFAAQIGDLTKLLQGEGSIKVAKEDPKAQSDDDTAPIDPAQILAGMLPLDNSAIPSRPVATKSGSADQGSIDSDGQKKDASPLSLPLASDKKGTGEENAKPLIDAQAQTGEKRTLSLAEDQNGAAKIADSATAAESDKNVNFAATLAQHTQAARNTDRTDNASSLNTHIQDASWSQDFSHKVVWMAKNEQQSAQLSINPPQLGPVQITLNLNGDQASAVFASPHAEVRQAIQDALPQLREMLAGAGIDLGQANVGSQLARQDNPQAQPEAPRARGDNAILAGDFSQSAASGGSASVTVKTGRGMVDLFA